MKLFSPWRKLFKILDGMDGDEVRKRKILRSASTLRMISPEHDYVSNEREKWKGGSCFIELLEMIPSTLVSHVYMSSFSIFLWNDIGYFSGRYSGRLWDLTARQYLRHSGIRESGVQPMHCLRARPSLQTATNVWSLQAFATRIARKAIAKSTGQRQNRQETCSTRPTQRFLDTVSLAVQEPPLVRRRKVAILHGLKQHWSR